MSASTRSPEVADTTFSLGYRPSLDGIRAFLVTVVLLDHAHLPGFDNGSVSIDGFLVLSGFLITALLLEEHRDRGAISLRHFWGRRILRLVPALVAMVGATLLALKAWSSEEAFAEHLVAARHTLTYVGNWVRAFGDDPMGLFSHTWSLALEEQFYLLWPPILILALRRVRAHGLAVGIAAAAVVAWWWRQVVASAGNWDHITNGLDTRADALLLGAFLAALLVAMGRPRGDAERLLRFVGPIAGGALLYAMVTHWDGWEYAFRGMTLVGVSMLLLVAHLIATPTSLTSRLLSARPLVWLGRLSYSLYLWHFPVFRLIDDQLADLPDSDRLWLKFVGSLLVSVVSYYGIERPFLRLKRRLTRTGDGRPNQDASTDTTEAREELTSA